MDFTINKYRLLLENLCKNNYSFLTFKDFLNSNNKRLVVLRHDVDLLPENSLQFARIQHQYGIKGTYYFRAVPQSWDIEIINEISKLGHEVGYHYENMDTVYKRFKSIKSYKFVKNKAELHEKLIDDAYVDFCENLEKLRLLVDVKTVCMHGSPLSKFDNKDIWKKYDYKNLNILGEPYFDINFDEVFYLTDTGRRWDGWLSSVRDKVSQQKYWNDKNLLFQSTDDIIIKLKDKSFPDKVMFNMHPQRWTNHPLFWIKEYFLQQIKNQIKRHFLIKK